MQAAGLSLSLLCLPGSSRVAPQSGVRCQPRIDIGKGAGGYFRAWSHVSFCLKSMNGSCIGQYKGDCYGGYQGGY